MGSAVHLVSSVAVSAVLQVIPASTISAHLQAARRVAHLSVHQVSRVDLSLVRDTACCCVFGMQQGVVTCQRLLLVILSCISTQLIL